jgi:hypothetical protein
VRSARLASSGEGADLANFVSVSAVGRSLERFLTAAFLSDPPIGTSTTIARLVRTEDFDLKNLGLVQKPFLSVFVYRVDFNKVMRAGWSAVGSLDGRPHLPVDLHVLLTAWGNDADSELKVLGRAMQALETTPILAGPLLLSAGEFAPNETIQVVLEDVSTEAVMRVFDSLPTDYKLSVPYIARIARIDGKVATPSPRVLTVVSGTAPTVAST